MQEPVVPGMSNNGVLNFRLDNVRFSDILKALQCQAGNAILEVERLQKKARDDALKVRVSESEKDKKDINPITAPLNPYAATFQFSSGTGTLSGETKLITEDGFDFNIAIIVNEIDMLDDSKLTPELGLDWSVTNVQKKSLGFNIRTKLSDSDKGADGKAAICASLDPNFDPGDFLEKQMLATYNDLIELSKFNEIANRKTPVKKSLAKDKTGNDVINQDGHNVTFLSDKDKNIVVILTDDDGKPVTDDHGAPLIVMRKQDGKPVTDKNGYVVTDKNGSIVNFVTGENGKKVYFLIGENGDIKTGEDNKILTVVLNDQESFEVDVDGNIKTTEGANRVVTLYAPTRPTVIDEKGNIVALMNAQDRKNVTNDKGEIVKDSDGKILTVMTGEKGNKVHFFADKNEDLMTDKNNNIRVVKTDEDGKPIMGKDKKYVMSSHTLTRIKKVTDILGTYGADGKNLSAMINKYGDIVKILPREYGTDMIIETAVTTKNGFSRFKQKGPAISAQNTTLTMTFAAVRKGNGKVGLEYVFPSATSIGPSIQGRVEENGTYNLEIALSHAEKSDDDGKRLIICQARSSSDANKGGSVCVESAYSNDKRNEAIAKLPVVNSKGIQRDEQKTTHFPTISSQIPTLRTAPDTSFEGAAFRTFQMDETGFLEQIDYNDGAGGEQKPIP